MASVINGKCAVRWIRRSGCKAATCRCAPDLQRGQNQPGLGRPDRGPRGGRRPNCHTGAGAGSHPAPVCQRDRGLRRCTLGVRIIGIDPASPANAPYRDGMVDGQYITADDTSGVLIGKTLAEKMGLKPGNPSTCWSTPPTAASISKPSPSAAYIPPIHPASTEHVFLPMAKAQAFPRPATTPARSLSCSRTARKPMPWPLRCNPTSTRYRPWIR